MLARWVLTCWTRCGACTRANSRADAGPLRTPPGSAGCGAARVTSCLASSTQQMNSLRARVVMSFHAASAVSLAISALRRSAAARAPRHRALAGCSWRQRSSPPRPVRGCTAQNSWPACSRPLVRTTGVLSGIMHATAGGGGLGVAWSIPRGHPVTGVRSASDQAVSSTTPGTATASVVTMHRQRRFPRTLPRLEVPGSPPMLPGHPGEHADGHKPRERISND